MSLDDICTNIRHEGCPTPMLEQRTEQQQPLPTWETHSHNPFNWSAKKKWLQLLVGSLVTFLIGLNSTVIATPGSAIARQFLVDISNSNIDNTVWPIAAWNTGAAVGPMIGIPLLEAFGMRDGYFVRRTFQFFY